MEKSLLIIVSCDKEKKRKKKGRKKKEKSLGRTEPVSNCNDCPPKTFPEDHGGYGVIGW
jgi:hypothetical protein